MFSTIRHGEAKTPPVAPPIPSAFGQKKNSFGPPPVRGTPSPANDHAAANAAPPPPPVPARARAEPEPEGEWADALYDYNSGVCNLSVHSL